MLYVDIPSRDDIKSLICVRASRQRKSIPAYDTGHAACSGGPHRA